MPNENKSVQVYDLRADRLITPDVSSLPPPVTPKVGDLPLRSSGWKAFERLMVAVVRDVHGWKDVREYGVHGQNQHGIDLFGYVDAGTEAAHSDMRVLTCQCKDVAEFNARDLREVVEKFKKGYRPFGSTYLAVAVSCDVNSTPIQEELHELRLKNPDLTIELWGHRQICEQLEDENRIVRRFFGEEWERAFCTYSDLTRTVDRNSSHTRKIMLDYLSRAEEASLDRLVSRWLATGIGDGIALELAGDRDVGAYPTLLEAVRTPGFHLVSGDFGSGKSVTAERVHQLDIRDCRDGDLDFIPVRTEARAIKESVEEFCQEIRSSLSIDPATPVRLVIDGLDEAGPVRAHEILASARAYCLIRTTCRILATSRHGVAAPQADYLQPQPILSLDEADALITRVAGVRHFSYGRSEAVLDAVRRPLFALIAASLTRSGRDLPRSAGGFLDELVNQALAIHGYSIHDLRQPLKTLARLMVEQRTSVIAVGELDDSVPLADIIQTRLVIKEGRSIKFALPIIEQYFAGLVLLDADLVGQLLGDLSALERWRPGLVLAVTVGSWAKITDILHLLSRNHPGLAAWIVEEAVPNRPGESDVPLPSSIEVARRISHGLQGWHGGFESVFRLLGLCDDNDQLVIVGARSLPNRMTVALRHRLPADDHAYEVLPEDFGFWSANSDWFMAGSDGAVATTYSAWPWHTSLRWVKSCLEHIVKHPTAIANVAASSAKEFNWLLARTLVDEAGRANHAPIEIRRLLDTIEYWLHEMDRHNYRSIGLGRRPTLNLNRAILLEFAQRLHVQEQLSDSVHRPYVVPDNLTGRGRWVWNLYSPANMHILCKQVFAAALSIYDNICRKLLPKVAPTLGLGSILPVAVNGVLELSNQPDYEGAPTVGYSMVPLPPGSELAVNIEIGSLPSWNDNSYFHNWKRAVSMFRPESAGWSRSTYSEWAFSAYKEQPATRLALRWLGHDLYQLHLLESNLHIDED